MKMVDKNKEEVKDEEKEAGEIIDDILDTLDLKSPNGEEKKTSEEEEVSEKKDEKTSEEDKEKVADGDEDEEDLERAEEEEAAEIETEEKEEEEEEEEEVPDLAAEMAEIKEQNKKLIKRLEATADEKEELEPKPKLDDTPKTFLGDDDIDEVVADPQKFEAVLNRVVKFVGDVVLEQVYKATPKLVISQIQQQTVVSKAVKEFYDENEDLVHVKRTVKAIANDIAADDPGLSLEDVFARTAIKTRETLGLKKKILNKKKNTKPVRKPALRTSIKRAARSEGPALSETEKDVMNTIL